jgi:hypothetical protein
MNVLAKAKDIANPENCWCKCCRVGLPEIAWGQRSAINVRRSGCSSKHQGLKSPFLRQLAIPWAKAQGFYPGDSDQRSAIGVQGKRPGKAAGERRGKGETAGKAEGDILE